MAAVRPAATAETSSSEEAVLPAIPGRTPAPSRGADAEPHDRFPTYQTSRLPFERRLKFVVEAANAGLTWDQTQAELRALEKELNGNG